MTTPTILITGATGKTGAATIEQLLERGHSIRAMVRVIDERAERLQAQGVDVVQGDFHDLQTIRSALDEVQRAYFCYPPQGTQLVDATAIFTIAAREVGVESIVNMSQITSRADARSPLTRQHWLSERVFDLSGLDVTHIRPTFFAENIVMFGAATIAGQGKLYLPFGDEKHAPVTASDIASVVTELLDDPAPHAGQTYILTGPDNLTVQQIVEQLSSELERPVEYVDLPIDAWGDVLSTVDGMSESLIVHLMSVAQDYHDGIFNAVTDDVQRIIGRPTQSLREFIRDVRLVFEPDGAQIAA